MLDEETVENLVWHWEEGWNTGDLDTIMMPFARDVVFSSPYVPKLTNPPATRIEGYDALHAYLEHALKVAPGIRYTIDATFIGAESFLIVYTCHNPDGSSQPGSDSMRVDEMDKVVEWHSHYRANVQIPSV